MSLLLNASTSHLFYQGQAPQAVSEEDQAEFLAFPKEGTSLEELRARILQLQSDAKPGSPYEEITRVGEPLSYDSFWNFGSKREVVPVSVRTPWKVPDVSDALFFEEQAYTLEHDIPYRERLIADRFAKQGDWLLHSNGRPAFLSVCTYDIETTQYGTGTKDIPIDMIGWSEFDVGFESTVDIESEDLDFRFTDLPTNWQDAEVVQEMARNRDEELDLLHKFTRHVVDKDVIAGHNILGFDNKQIQDRLKDALQRDDREQHLEPSMRSWFEEFLGTYSKHDRSFHFGTSQDISTWYPMTLDTFHASRKFFFFHDDHSLKGLAPWLGVHVEGRQYLEHTEMKLDETTMLYNKHDVQEQLGVTMNLIAQALPLCFTVNLPMDELLTGGNTKMWDHMALVRGRREKKILPATCRAQGVSRAIQSHLGIDCLPTREEVAEAARKIPDDARRRQKEFIRVAKQGPEMPIWCEHPGVQVKLGDGPDGTGYEIVGGLTLKPDSDLKSHFTPWFHVVEADVGAMYPTILKARNLTADTVRPAYAHEAPDEWLWLFDVDANFRECGKYHVRKPLAEEEFTNGRGWMVGVKEAPEDGLVNKAMTGILATIQKVKDARAEAKKSGADKDQIRILDMTYASLKAARNAGTHGIMVAVGVSCRQFNMWGGARITTIGQEILDGTRRGFEKENIRVVYGDTDGIYLACSRSAGNLPAFAEALGADVEPEQEAWMTDPRRAIEAIKEANDHWRKWLDYDGFELEAEQSDAMVFVVHKNYLKFSQKNGKFVMDTKGNNFKGSDKAPIAREILSDIMKQALADVASWTDEEEAREAMKVAIKRATKDVMTRVDIRTADMDSLTLRQKVDAIRKYKPNADGSASHFAVRTAAIEHLLEEEFRASRKMKFIVCKEPLPAYVRADAKAWLRDRLAANGFSWTERKLAKSSVKPIEYMWPLDQVKPEMIDWAWYRDTVEAYVKGAFGFQNLELATQRDLSSWF